MRKNVAGPLRGKPVLVTGANGFVASYLIPRLTELGASVHGVDLDERSKVQGCEYHCLDLLNFGCIKSFVAQYRPSFVFHLASQSSVGTSWKHEWRTIETNTRSVYNLLKAVEKLSLSVRILLVSSIEVYGDHGRRKVNVGDDLRPANPYAVSKAAMEMIAHKFSHSTIEFVIARSSNHTGPGRSEMFFEANVAKQFAQAKYSGKKSISVKVGNVENIRDYSDVRDVVEKYIFLACQGEAGKTYNVCSGTGTRLSRIIEMLEECSGIAARVEVDRSRLRKNDIAYLVGVNHIRLKSRPLPESIEDLYRYFLEQCPLR